MIYTISHSVFDFRMKPIFASKDMSKFKVERVNFRYAGLKGLMGPSKSSDSFLCEKNSEYNRECWKEQTSFPVKMIYHLILLIIISACIYILFL